MKRIIKKSLNAFVIAITILLTFGLYGCGEQPSAEEQISNLCDKIGTDEVLDIISEKEGTYEMLSYIQDEHPLDFCDFLYYGGFDNCVENDIERTMNFLSNSEYVKDVQWKDSQTQLFWEGEYKSR